MFSEAASRLASGGDAELAKARLTRAIALAEESGVLVWKLRAATHLARQLLAEGDVASAASTLRPVYGAFTEGHDTPLLREAAEVLEVAK